MKPTIKDVARMAKVSISTVSRVMNAPETVAESKRARVLQAIEELQYQPNALAQGLISKKSNTLGVLIPDIRNPYYSDVIRGMEDAAKLLGYSLLICNTDRDEERLISYLENFYVKQVDGIIFASDFLRSSYYEAIQRLQFPAVLVSTSSTDFEIPSVQVDEEQAGYDAVRHLIEYGHRNIGMICFPLDGSVSGPPRYEGFVRALRENGLEQYSTCVEFADQWFEEAYEAAAKLFTKHPDLTAVFTASDEFAMGVISYLADQGISVPGQVSVIGFDNIRMAHIVIPKLTTIAQPVYQMGHMAVEKLHELITTGSVKVLRESVPHQLIVRDSTRSILSGNSTI
ncbi:LacI family DNA-binding transcriptional regulator [Paenibacillus sediminis]|uniref:LacI family transcriptional regulator n=1 Tax=Paenibacillus sediminis TaxID=664909 RepID=A0ABS4H354_9BACL|nr:LacI family DNA-binding transcriptional regulator [Paenibacillus sediminis]MBP1936891.1 LacI family transcriptional regulator [Paenibacillus sediminis]